MAVLHLATFICLVESAIFHVVNAESTATVGSWNSQKYMPRNYMPAGQTYGGHYQMYMKPADAAGRYGADFQRYTNDALDYTKHMAMHEPKASGDEHSPLPGGQFFAGGAQHGAGYKQFAGSYARGYDKFMDQGKGTSQASYSKGQAGDYQKYMGQYTGDDSDYQTYSGNYGQYHKYVSQGGANIAQSGDHQKYMQFFAADDSQKHAGSNAQYQEYMDKFAQDYYKLSSQASDYDKFVQDYAASFQHGMSDKASDLSKYSDQFTHDYNKYSSQAADYKKYVQDYTASGSDKVSDLSTYMVEHATNHSKYMEKFANDYRNFSSQTGDYGKYVQGYATHNGGGKVGDYSKFVDQYTGDSKLMDQFAQDYNKYSSQAADYQKFVQDYAASFQHDISGKAGDYSKYSDQFTGDLHNIMDRYMEQVSKSGDHSGKSSQGEDFEKYMDKYARDTKKQQHQASKDASHEGATGADKEHKTSEDEHKSSGKTSSVAAAQFFAVPHGAGAYHPQASKYMDMYSWGQPAPEASYQKEHSVPDEASYWNYRQSFAGLEASHGPSPVAAVDFLAAQPTAVQGSAHQQQKSNALDHQGQHDFIKEFAGSWAPSQSGASQQDFNEQYASKYMSSFTPGVSNYSDQHAWKESFKQQYFKQYAHYEQARKALQAKFPHIPNSVSECKNVSQVKEWEAAETASITAYVPEEYRTHAIAAVKKAAIDSAKELRAEEAAASNSTSKSNAENTLGSTGESSKGGKAAANSPSASAVQFFAAQTTLSHEQHVANDHKVVAYQKALQDYAAAHQKASAEGANVHFGDEQRHHFMKEFAGGWAPTQPGASQHDYKEQYAAKYMNDIAPRVSNYSDQQAWKDSFKKQYFKQYTHYEQARKALQAKFPHVPNSVSECKNVSQVKEWEAAETASIDAYVPEEYRAHAVAAVKKAATDSAKQLLAKSSVESSSSSKSTADSSKANQGGHAVEDLSASSPSDAQAKPGPEASAAQFFAAHPAASYEQVAAHDKADKEDPEADAKSADEDEQRQRFMKQFAGSWAPAQPGASKEAFKAQYASEYMAPGVSNYSNQHAWKESFKQQYYAQYAHYEESRKAVQAKFPHVPNSASECQNVSQVKEWVAAETASIDVFVPTEYREHAIAAVKKSASGRITELKTRAAAPSSGSSSSNVGKSKSEETTDKEAGGLHREAASGKTQTKTGKQSEESPSAAKPANSASESAVASSSKEELAGKVKEFLQARTATDGAAKPSSASKESASTSTRANGLALSSVLAYGRPGAASLPAVAVLLSVLAFASVAAVVAKRRQLSKPSARTGLASPLLEA